MTKKELEKLRKKYKDYETDKLIEALEAKDKEIENERMKSFALMSEVVRLRRVGEILADERDSCIKRAEAAERGMRNLRRWIQLSD